MSVIIGNGTRVCPRRKRPRVALNLGRRGVGCGVGSGVGGGRCGRPVPGGRGVWDRWLALTGRRRRLVGEAVGGTVTHRGKHRGYRGVGRRNIEGVERRRGGSRTVHPDFDSVTMRAETEKPDVRFLDAVASGIGMEEPEMEDK